jgi:hypothetical protein
MLATYDYDQEEKFEERGRKEEGWRKGKTIMHF